MKEYIAKDTYDAKGRIIGRTYGSELVRCENCASFTKYLTEYFSGREEIVMHNYCHMWNTQTVPEGYCYKAEKAERNEYNG